MLRPNVTLQMEVEDLRNASPATVSRAGVIFISSNDLGWRPMAQGYLKNRRKAEVTQLLLLGYLLTATCLRLPTYCYLLTATSTYLLTACCCLPPPYLLLLTAPYFSLLLSRPRCCRPSSTNTSASPSRSSAS